jgi:hypothetical protein
MRKFLLDVNLKIAKSTDAPENDLEYSIKVDKQSILVPALFRLMQSLFNKKKDGGNNLK